MSAEAGGTLVVETPAGAVRGAREGGVSVFRGVPFAEPPVGELRWRPARPHQGWAGVWDATRNGPIAVQSKRSPFSALLGDPIGDAPMSEDCLNLTIWTPAADDRPRPVMVWIHGGGFMSGAGSWDIYSGAALAAHGDVVVVGINYRIGPLGYLYLGSEDPAGGNFGLTDQVCALEWVQRNIAAFGGDSEQITLFGQSAGAWSIAAILGLPDAPKVRRAILQSGPLTGLGREPSDAQRWTERYMETLGVDSVAALRALPVEELMAAIPRLAGPLAEWGKLVLPFQPTYDGAMLSRPALPALTDPDLSVELIVGWNRREMSFFFASNESMWDAPRESVVDRMRDAFGDRAEDAYRLYADRAPGAPPIEILLEYGRDRQFRLPAVDLAQARAERGLATWLYEFDVSTPALDGRVDAAHCLEAPFVFQTQDAWRRVGAGMFAGFDFGSHRHVGEAMHNAWWRFAREGTPRDPAWSPYAPGQSVMRFGADNRSAPDTGVSRRAWDEFASSDTGVGIG